LAVGTKWHDKSYKKSELVLMRRATAMLEVSFAGCLVLSPVISTQFTLEMCVAASNRKKIH